MASMPTSFLAVLAKSNGSAFLARKPSPWWWEAEQGWYVNIQGKRQPLGKHPPGAPAPRQSKRTGKWNAPKEIEDAFYKLMRGDSPRPTDDEAVVAILDDFLVWC